MEADNILSYQMQISRPELVILLRAFPITLISDSCNIVGQCVKPHINHMPVIKVYRNAPLKGSSRYTQILQPRQKEIVHHFILTGYRLNKFRVGIDVLNQLIRIFAHLKKVCLFLCRLYFPSAVRTFAIHQLGFCPERFAGRTIQPFIGTFINIPLMIQFLKNLLYLLFVVIICGTDKMVIRRIHQIPQIFDCPCHIIHKFLRSNSRFLCLQFNLLSMLVRACLEKDIIAVLSFKSGNTVSQHDFIAVADMGLARRISNSCRNIILSFTHVPFPPKIKAIFYLTTEDSLFVVVHFSSFPL